MPAPGPHPAPALVAATDQHLAALRDLVQLARDHVDALVHDCPPGLPCPGGWAWDRITAMHPHHRASLLALAAAELAALGYGLPASADRYVLTDAGRAALDKEQHHDD